MMETLGDSLSTVTTTDSPTARKSFRFSRRQSIALVFSCTVFGAAAQILIKSGANALSSTSPLAMITNLPLMAGYSLYGISTILLVLALRDGELSILYPVISLTYVWVTFLSVLFFKDSMNFFKIIGVFIIVTGVAVLGRKDKK
jgi:multidrug transporter EmrE-like cation transporter